MRNLDSFEAEFDANRGDWEAAANGEYPFIYMQPPGEYLEEAEQLLGEDAEWTTLHALAFWMKAEDQEDVGLFV
jgi:hypothetical protein